MTTHKSRIRLDHTPHDETNIEVWWFDQCIVCEIRWLGVPFSNWKFLRNTLQKQPQDNYVITNDFQRLIGTPKWLKSPSVPPLQPVITQLTALPSPQLELNLSHTPADWSQTNTIYTRAGSTSKLIAVGTAVRTLYPHLDNNQKEQRSS